MKNTKIKVIGLTLALFIILVGSGVVIAAVQLRGRVLPSTFIADRELSMVAPTEIAQEVQRIINGYTSVQLPVSLEGGLTKRYSLDELGVHLDASATANRLEQTRVIDNLSPRAVWSVFTAASDHTVEPVFTINPDRLGQVFTELTRSASSEPVDAQLTITDGRVLVTPAQNGYQFDYTVFEQEARSRIAQLSAEPIVISGSAVTPYVTESDLAPAADNLRSVLAQGLSLVTPGVAYSITPAELGSWIVPAVDSSSGFTWNDELIRKKIRGIAREQDQEARPTKVIGSSETVVEEGHAGVVVDQEAAYSAIISVLSAGLNQRLIEIPTSVVQPERVEVASSAAPSNTSGKSIRVVLSEQRLYAWEDGQLARTFLVSTGLTGPTPVGNWAIHNKTFVQPYSGPGYYLPDVYYSSWFLPEISIHQAYWHNNFGQPMSHGCVNATLEDAKFIYEWAPIGTPVEVVP